VILFAGVPDGITYLPWKLGRVDSCIPGVADMGVAVGSVKGWSALPAVTSVTRSCDVVVDKGVIVSLVFLFRRDESM
jgi:hypothetical protein